MGRFGIKPAVPIEETGLSGVAETDDAVVVRPAAATAVLTSTDRPMARHVSVNAVCPASNAQVHGLSTPVATTTTAEESLRRDPTHRAHHSRDVAGRKRCSNTSRSSVSSSKRMSLTAIANKGVSRNGMLSTIVYVVLATMLAISTYALDTIANTPIDLGIVEQAWDHDIFDAPINTFMQGTATVADIKNNVPTQRTTHGTQSLSDLQYDTCGVRDWTCAAMVRPNTERVLYLLGSSFSFISGFDVPEIASSPEKIEFKYVNTLTGFNYPVVQYHIPGNDWAVVCSVRRTYYRVAQEAESKGEIDSVAFCSKRKYDPTWMCENEVAKDVTTYVIKVKVGKVTYLGSALRGEMYYKPGNVAKLTGSAQGTGLLSTVIGIDEYNGGILQSSAPWDMVPAYLCKGTFNADTYAGMRWQGQGVVSMTWTSSSLMVTNSFVLWSLTMSLAVIQFVYLPKSSVCVIPVSMAKTVVGPVILGYACYGNYNVQVLTTYLSLNKVTSFDATPYRLCGPVMFSSVISLMSGTAIQVFFNPLLVSPSYMLTIVSLLNWVVVFVLEVFIFPRASVMLTRKCGLASSTTCTYFSATVSNYYLSPLIAACGVTVGILVVMMIQKRASKTDLPVSNSVLKLLHSTTVRDLATSGAGGCVVAGPDGTPLVDAGILLNKNLVRISSTSLVRSCIVKYVLLYRLLPSIFQRSLSCSVGVTLVIKAEEDRVLKEVAFLELKYMKIGPSKLLPSYYA